MRAQRTAIAAWLLAACLAQPAFADHTIVPVDITDWGPETDANRLPDTVVSSLDVAICADHFPVGSDARNDVEKALELFDFGPLDVRLVYHDVSHQQKADLYADPPAYPLAVDYVDNDDPSTVDGQPCHPDPNDVSCGSWTANTCRYAAGFGWRNGLNDYQDAAVIAVNADCYTHDDDDDGFDGTFMDFNGISHEMGHVLGLKHAGSRPYTSDKFQTKMIQAIGTLSPYDLEHLRQEYPAMFVLANPEFTSTPAIRQQQPDGTIEFGKGSFQDFNPTDLYLDGSEYKACGERDYPAFTAQFFDNGYLISEPDVEVEFSVQPSGGVGFTSAYRETVLTSTHTHRYNQLEVTTDPLVLTDADLGAPVGPTPVSATLRFTIDPDHLVFEIDESNNVQELTLWLYEEGGLCPERPVRVTAPARHGTDRFGKAVAVTGTTLVAGAPEYDFDEAGGDERPDAGAVFVSQVNGNGTSTLLDVLLPLGRLEGGQFGRSVSATSNRIAVGEPFRDALGTIYGDVPEAGAAYVFVKNGSTWTQEAKVSRAYVEPGTDYDHFGKSVALSPDGTWLAVGAPGNDLDENGANYLADSGAVYLYELVDGSWIYRQKVIGNHVTVRRAGDEFGDSVALTNDHLLVGAPNHDWNTYDLASVSNAGAAFVFTEDGGTWTVLRKIAAPDREVDDHFGSSVAAYQHADGETSLAIGAPDHDLDAAGANPESDAGAVYVFKTGCGGVCLPGSVKVTAPNGRSRNVDDGFGTSVAISGNRLVAGAPRQDWGRENLRFLENAGAAFVFEPTSLTDWGYRQKLTGQYANGKVANDRFGKSVAISADLIAAGVPRQDFDQDGLDEIGQAGLCFAFFR